MSLRKILLTGTACISLCIGGIGIFVPFIPSVPFFMLTAFCLAKSSERLHKAFCSSTLYKKHLQSWAEKRGMTLRSKICLLLSLTLLLGLAFVLMRNTNIGRIVVLLVWILHVLYFVFGVKTLREI